MDTKTLERFMGKVRPNLETGCWEWTAGTFRFGYGHFHLEKGKDVRAPRFAYEAFIGPIPEGQVVRHRCDNPPCVNPGHLELGTHADNNRDRSDRGRGAQQKRTHCPRGHELVAPNLSEWEACRGTRKCLACSRGQNNVNSARRRGHPVLDLKAEADRHFALIREGNALVPQKDRTHCLRGHELRARRTSCLARHVKGIGAALLVHERVPSSENGHAKRFSSIFRSRRTGTTS